jgi:Uma2 family endonuclease
LGSSGAAGLFKGRTDRGVLYLTPRPDVSHGNVVSRLVGVLINHLRQKRDKGMLYVPRAGIMGENTWLEPDFFYVSSITETRLKGEYHTNADLVVEVISAESAVYDRHTKSDTYGALRVKELWLVDELGGTIEIRVLKDNAYKSHLFDRDHQMKSVFFPDLKLKVRDAFEN